MVPFKIQWLDYGGGLEEWQELKEKIHYDFLKDNNFSELKESELMTSRLQLMQLIDPYVGVYFSKAWIKKKVLHLNEDEVEKMEEEIAEEGSDEPQMPAIAPGALAPVQQPVAAAPAANDINSMFKSQLSK